MSKKWKRYYLSQLFLGILIFLTAANALAGAPFLTDDPEPVAYRHWEFYLFTYLDKNNVLDEEPNLNAPAIDFNYGALPNLQLHFVVPYAWSLPTAAPFANGLGDIELGMKYRFIQETNNFPQVGIFPLLELPTGDATRNLGNGKMWVKLPLWIQKSWGAWTSYGGGGYAINHAMDARNFPYTGWLLQKKLNEKLTIGTEVFSQGAFSNNSRPFTIMNLGGYYDFTKHFSLLFNAGHSIIGEQHLISYLGLYWTGP